MVAATSALIASLLGIVALFSLKYRESKTGRTYFPVLRASSDNKALALKAALLRGRTQLEHLPPIMMILLRSLVRMIALKFASLLRRGENQAHRLADIVTYKHRLERRETRSEFLKQVSDHKNGEGVRETPSVGHEHDEIAG